MSKVCTTSKFVLPFVLLFIISCGTENNSASQAETDSLSFIDSAIEPATFDSSAQIALYIRCIFEDASGNIWFGTNGQGVMRYNPNAAPDSAFTTFTELNGGICSNYINTIDQDPQGNMWFNTAFGVCSYDGKSFTTYADSNGPIKDVSLIASQSSDADMWFDTNDGAYHWDGTLFHYYALPMVGGDVPFLPAKYSTRPGALTVYDHLKSKTHAIWFATVGWGVCRYELGEITWFSEEMLRIGALRTIYEDRAGKIWTGSNGGGVCCYDGKKWVNFSEEQGLSKSLTMGKLEDPLSKLNRIWCITEDNAGNMWFATFDEGVWKYDGHTMTNYTAKNGLTGNSVWTIIQDKSGTLWFGMNGGGVCTYDGHSFTNFTKKQIL